MRRILAATLLATLPTAVFADGDAILVITNDAGAVTTVLALSDRECHAAAALLSEPRPAEPETIYFTNGSVVYSHPPPHTSELTKAECVRPDVKKP